MKRLMSFALFFCLNACAIGSGTAQAQPLEVLDCDSGTRIGSFGAWDCAAATGGASSASIIAAPSTLNPITANDTASRALMAPIFGMFLTTYSQLGAGPLTPRAASVIETSEDGTTITFTLRSGLTFSDGTSVTTDDLLYWFNDVAFNPNLPNSFASVWSCSDGSPFDVQAVSGDTVTVSCPDPYRTFQGAAATLPLLSKEMALDLIADQGITTDDGVNGPQATSEFMSLGIDISELRGLGPFVLDELVSDQVARYSRNPNFYGVDSNGTQLPYLDNFEFNIFPTNGQNLALSAFLNGQTEVIDLRASDIAPVLGQAAGGGFSVNSDIDNGTPSLGQTFVTINYDDDDPNLAAVARNAQVRRALSLAIDRVAMVNNVHLGLATPQYVPVSLSGSGAPFFIGRNNTCDDFINAGLAGADNCAGGVWSTDQGLFMQVTSLPEPYADPSFDELLSCLNDYAGCIDQANATLDGLGLADTDGDGVRNIPSGFDSDISNSGGNWIIQVTTNVGNTDREGLIQIVCDGWTQLGIDCHTNPIAFSTLITQLNGLGGATWSGGIVMGLTGGDPAAAINVLKCGAALYFWHLSCDPSATNGSTAQLHEDAAVEAGFDQGFAATTVAGARAGFDQEQIAFIQGQPFIHLVVQNALFAVRTDRLCNDGHTVRANFEVKFRVDVSGNENVCGTNVGRSELFDQIGNASRKRAFAPGGGAEWWPLISGFKDYGDGL